MDRSGHVGCWGVSPRRSVTTEFLHQTGFIGEHAGLPFRVNRHPIDGDLEHSTTGWHEFDLCCQHFFYFCRQTDGAVPVASLVAIFDGDLHGSLLVVAKFFHRNRIGISVFGEELLPQDYSINQTIRRHSSR